MTDRRPLVLLLLIGMCGSAMADGEYRIIEMFFLPPKFYVGDLVELRIGLNIPPDAEIAEPAETPNSRWLWIEHVEVAIQGNQEAEVRLRFRSFQPGTQLLPPIDLGDIVLQGIRFSTSSLLDEEQIQKLRPFRSQVILPYTWLKVGAMALAVLFLPILAYRGAVWSSARVRMLRSAGIRKRAFLSSQESLQRLRRAAESVEAKVYYGRLSALVRRYLQARLGIGAETTTTNEMAAVLCHALDSDRLIEELIELLRISDAVKFAGRESQSGEMIDMVDRTLTVMRAVEEERARVES